MLRVEEAMKIGFIGLGTMGQHMAMNLIRGGHSLTVHDIRREAASAHLAAGATWADAPGGVAAGTEVVFTSLPGPVEVEAVALGEKGLFASMRSGTAYFDLTTNSPTLLRRLHAQFAERGVAVLDA